MNKRECLDDFELIVFPHLDATYNLAYWLVRNPSQAEDVVQNAALRALKYFASFRGDSARAWLLQIVHNVSYAHINAPRSRMEVLLEEGMGVDIPDPDAGPEATLAHRDEVGQVNKGLNALPVTLRECLVLRELEGLSYRHIAQITGVSIGTVMSRLSRARQSLSKVATVSSVTARLPPDSTASSRALAPSLPRELQDCVVRSAVDRREALLAGSAAATAVADAVRAGEVPRHPNEQPAVVAKVGRPPLRRP